MRTCATCADGVETSGDAVACRHLAAFVAADTEGARCWELRSCWDGPITKRAVAAMLKYAAKFIKEA